MPNKPISERSAEALWNGDLKSGKGTVRLGSGAFTGDYSFDSRFGQGQGTTPEELVGAAHASCFAMAFSAKLAGAGHTPRSVEAKATVHFEDVDGLPTVVAIDLKVLAEVPGIGEFEFQEVLKETEAFCPISRALAAVPNINVRAELKA